MSKVLKAICILAVFAILVAMSLVISVQPAYADMLSDLTDNSSTNPYVINTKEQYFELAELVNGGTSMQDKYFALATDLDFSSDEYVIIGDSINSFRGYFDGRNHTITVNINVGTPYAGVFGYIGARGTVINLIVKGTIVGNNYLGGIAGYNEGNIDLCINSATVTAASVDTKYVGGIAGESSGAIINCANIAKITANAYVGGIVGRLWATSAQLAGCINVGEISVTEGFTNATRIGGLVGDSKGVLNNSYNYAVVNATGDRIGSLVGNLTQAPSGTVNCYNINARSKRNEVGQSEVVKPLSFTAKTLYDFLSGSITFAENTLEQIDYDEGYGYLYYPFALAENVELREAIRICLYSDGNGAELDPFVIADNNTWNLFAENIRHFNYSSQNILLSSDLDLGTISPLGLNELPFNGKLNGGMHTLTYNVSGASCVGLFGKLGATARIFNLKLSGDVVATGNYVGALCGTNGGADFSNVENNCSVTGVSYVGGLCGETIGGTFENLTNKNEIKGISYVGGIFGSAQTSVFAGISNYASVTAVTNNANEFFGGIAGKLSEQDDIIGILNTGKVDAYRAQYVGGIAGFISKTTSYTAMQLCNTIDIIGKNYVGGVFGKSQGVAIAYSTNISNVTGANYVGGLVGESDGNIFKSYFCGKLLEVRDAVPVRTTFKTITNNAVSISDVYYNYDLRQVTDNGIAKNYIEMTDDIFVGDSTELWEVRAMTANYGYYPIPNFPSVATNNELIESKFKINYFGGGNGTVDDIYTIGNEQQLRNLMVLANNYNHIGDYLTKNYMQTADITLTREFTAIGNETAKFSGSYDGNYYEISNLTIDSVNNYIGLFACLTNGAVITEIGIGVGSITGENYVGALAGFAENGAAISYCYSLADVKGNGSVGGLVGTSYASIEYSFVADCIILCDSENAGGLTGTNKGEINYSFFSAIVKGANAVGGLVGNNEGDINYSYTSGTVYVTASNGYGGGLAGKNLLGDIAYSYVLALVQGNGGLLGGLVGAFVNTSLATMTHCFYNQDILGSIPQYYVGTTSYTANTGVLRDTETMLSPAFLGDLNYSGFSFGLSSSKDSAYAPRITEITSVTDEKFINYSKESVMLRYFGWDNMSAEPWGSTENPYVISTPSQLSRVSTLTSEYDYANCVFVLKNNLDMSGISFLPIGSYTSAAGSNNHAFNGIFDGKGYAIANLSVDRLYPYAGLFGYVGAIGKVKNIVLEETCTIMTSVSYAGSIVGFLAGTVDRVLSYATVSATNYVGGIAGYAMNGASVTNSVFNGEIPIASGSFFGILGIIPDANLNIDTINSWYVYKNNTENNFVYASLPYSNNGYGSVLFVDRRGDVLTSVDTVTEDKNSVKFTLLANEHYKGFIYSGNDSVIFNGSAFFPRAAYSAVAAGNNVNIFVRFCQKAELEFADASEQAYMTNYASGYGNGYYYEGQNVTFTITMIKGYYLEYLADYVSGGYTLRNVSNSVTLSFEMQESDTDSFYAPVAIADAISLVNIASADLTADNCYDGSQKDVEVTFVSGGELIFGNYTIAYYFGPDKDGVSMMKNAGDYLLYVYMYPIGHSEVFTGIVEANFTINKKELTAIVTSEAQLNYWDSVVGKKEYDGTATITQRTINNAYLNTVIAEDVSSVIVKADVAWANAMAGSGKTYVVSNFVLFGDAGDNYYISTSSVSGSNGEITRKLITVTVLSSDLGMEFSGSSPIIRNPQVNGSLGESRLVWSYSLLKADDTVNEDWALLGVKTWNVGRYSVSVASSDTANYDVGFGDSQYIFTITSKTVGAVNYMNYTNKTYTGAVLSGNIRCTYITVNGTAFADLTYYYGSIDENNKITSGVVNAGSYIAIPSIPDNNYTLSDSIENLYFSVAKSSMGGAIEYSLAKTALTVNEEVLISFISNIYDATPVVQTLGVTRAKFVITERDGDYYLKATAYSASGSANFRIMTKDSQNYEDRYSEYEEVQITPLKIYVGLSKNEYSYGDVITSVVVYSKDKAQTDKYSDETVASFDGFVPSEYNIVASVFEAGKRYTVNIYGGSFDGYEIAVADTAYINIVKKKISIIVSDEITTNTKIYGDSDKDIGYYINDGDGRKITDLPNGNTLIINGKLFRTAGESVGKYDISAGTVTAENNMNFDISFEFRTQYVITQREIGLYIPEMTKAYGSEDPNFTVAVNETSSLASWDTISAITVTIIREQGENIGIYPYTVKESSGGKNYFITGITNDKYFVIIQAEPVVTYQTKDKILYGDSVSSLPISGSAGYEGKSVKGKFVWEDNDLKATDMGYLVAGITFIPEDNNYARIKSTTILSVEKRVLTVNYAGKLEYSYNGSEQCEISAEIINIVEGDEVDFTTYKNATPIAAGNYIFGINIVSDKYVLDEATASVVFVIFPKVIEVSIENITVLEGESYTLSISYSGFAEGEDERMLTSKATVKTLPKTSGYHTVTAEGASADNYNFAYLPATVIINQKKIATDGIALEGNIKAGVSVATQDLTNNEILMSANEKLINKALNVKLFKPIKQSLVGYVDINISERISGSYKYTMILPNVKKDSDTLYLINYDGTVISLEDYEMSEDGKTVTFTAEAVTGLAIYSQKTIMETVLGYVPIAIAAVSAILIIVIIAAVISAKSKKNKKMKAYLEFIDRT